jgi:four helix bundle protein
VKQFEELQGRTRRFALRIIKLYRSLPKTDEARILGKQVLRSGTSIGANYRAACRARSRTEFVAKLGIVLEEADETAFWLEFDAGCRNLPGGETATDRSGSKRTRFDLCHFRPHREGFYFFNLTSDF